MLEGFFFEFFNAHFKKLLIVVVLSDFEDNKNVILMNEFGDIRDDDIYQLLDLEALHDLVIHGHFEPIDADPIAVDD